LLAKCHFPTIAVSYPTACKPFGNVACDPSNSHISLSRNPFLCECFPVRIDARDGPQIEFVQYDRRNNAPSFAIRSRFGVGAASFKWLPYAEIAANA
jgi:hypothetical protein